MSANRNTTYEFRVKTDDGKKNVDDLSNAYKEAAEAAKASVTAQKAALQNLDSTLAVLNQERREFSRVIADNRRAAEELRQEITVLRGKEKEESDEVRELAARHRELSDQTRLLTAENGQVSASIREVTAEQRELQTQLTESKKRVKELEDAQSSGGIKASQFGQVIRVAGAESRLLGESMAGVARPLSMVIGGIGVLSPQMLVLTAIIGLAAAAIQYWRSQKEQIIKLDEQQIALDTVTATLTGNRLRLDADIIASFASISAESEKYKKNTIELQTAITNLGTKGIETKTVYNNLGIASQEIVRGTKDLELHVSGLTNKLGEQDKQMQPAIQSLISIRNLYGLNNDELIKLAQSLGFANKGTEDDAKSLQFLREKLDEDLPSLRALASELTKTTDLMGDMERQAIRTAIAVKEIKPPKLDLDFLRSQVTDYNAEIQRAMGAASGGFSLGPPTSAQLEAAIRPTLEAIRTELRKNAAEMSNSTEETKRNYELLVGKLNPEYQLMILHLDKADHNMKAFADTTAKQEAAAHKLVITTSELRKELEQYTAKAESGNKFDIAEGELKARISAKARELAENKQLTLANQYELAAIELEGIKKINNDRVKARQTAEAYIAAINAKTIIDEYDAHKAAIAVKLASDVKYFTDLGLDSAGIFTNTIKAKREREEEFQKWFVDRNKKSYEELTREGAKFEHSLAQERQKEDQAGFKESLKSFDLHEQQIQALIQKFSHSKGTTGVLDVGELDKSNERLKALGVTAQTVEARFGRASDSLTQFNQRIKVFELIQQGHPFQAMALEMQQLADAMRNSQTDAQRWSKFLSDAINQMGSNIEQGFEGLVNGTISFGQLMKKLMFDLIASLAEHWGAYYLALGIADIWNNPAKGAAELAAGAALMALAGVLHALGNAQANKSSAQAATGGGNSASAGATGSSRAAIPPQLVPVPTTPQGPNSANIFGGQSAGDQAITLILESPGPRAIVDWIDGKDIVHKTIIKKRREIKKTLGVK